MGKHMGKEGMGGKRAEINSAAKPNMDHGGAPRGKARTAGVGNERRADTYGAIEGSPTDGNPLSRARDELYAQHPEKHDDLGPHHGSTAHLRKY